MALIAIAADKGAPGVTTSALALASVWPGPVLLAECDPAGGDLAFRFPAAGGGQLDPRRGLLSLAVAGRRDYQQQQVWAHAQKIHGGLDVLLGVTNAEQGAGLSTLWGPLGTMLAGLPGVDVIADCGRLGPEGPLYDLLTRADSVLLVARPDLADVIRLRDRAGAVVASATRRGQAAFAVDVLTIAEPQRLKNAGAEVAHALKQAGVPVGLSCGLADDRKGAELLGGTWGGKLDKTLLMRTAREVAGQLAARKAPSPAQRPPSPAQLPPSQPPPAELPASQPPPFQQEQPPPFQQEQRPPAYQQTPMRPVPADHPAPVDHPAPAEQHPVPTGHPVPPADPRSPAAAQGPVPVFRPRHASPQADGSRGR